MYGDGPEKNGRFFARVYFLFRRYYTIDSPEKANSLNIIVQSYVRSFRESFRFKRESSPVEIFPAKPRPGI